MKDKKKKYDCRICPYVGYKDEKKVFCSFCMKLILERKPAIKAKDAVNG